MLTHLDSSKRPSQARHVGPPGEDPSSTQARSAHADTPGPFKETLAGEARRPTKKGLQNQLPCQGSHCRRGTSAHQERSPVKLPSQGSQRRRGTSAHQARLTLSKSNQATDIINIIIVIMGQQYEPFKQYLSYCKMARHVCVSWSWARANLPTFIKHNKP